MRTRWQIISLLQSRQAVLLCYLCLLQWLIILHKFSPDGTIELPIDKVMNWVGGFTDANAAIQFIASGGTPVVGLISGGKIVAARKEHVWVEAYVKYYPLRGAAHKTGQGDTWIPLDASYKQYNYTQGIDIKTAVPFDAEAFVNQIKTTATIDEANSSVTNVNSAYIQQQMQSYQAQVQAYIEQNYPDATVGDVLGKKEIIKQEFTYLLGTLPYRKSLAGVKFSEIPDGLRHKVTFKVTKDIYDEEMGTALIITKRLPEIAGKRITLSYIPATAQDEQVINSYLPKPHADGSPIQPSELPTSLPAYLIKLKPELRIDGEVVATGSTVGMGYQETFDMVFTEPGPGGGNDVVSNQIDAGAYHAIAINTGKIPKSQMLALKEKLEATKARLEAGDVTDLTKDDILGDILFATALSYYVQFDLMNEIQAQTMGVKVLRWPSESIFASAMKINLFYGIPHTVAGGGLLMDVDRSLNVVASLDGDKNKTVPFMQVSGMNGSALEHAVPEMMFSTPDNPVEGVSAVKALQIANNQGIPVYTINQSNISAIMPQLQVDAQVKADIQNAVNAGKVVTVSKTNITYNGWTGCGYIIINPTTGAGAYMISGGLSGGFITAMLLLVTALLLLAVIAAIIITGGMIGAIVGSIAICLLPVYLAIQAWLAGMANADQRVLAFTILVIVVALISTPPIITTAGLAYVIGIILALYGLFMYLTAAITFESERKYYCFSGGYIDV